jgi:hypothetical protein
MLRKKAKFKDVPHSIRHEGLSNAESYYGMPWIASMPWKLEIWILGTRKKI